jgi:hypothetical protein
MQLFVKEGDSRKGSYTSSDCTQRKLKGNDSWEGRHSRHCCQEQTKWDPQTQTKEESQNMCYKAVKKRLRHLWFWIHNQRIWQIYRQQGDCEDGVDFTTQPLKPNDFVLLKLATKKAVKYFIGLIQKMKPDFWISDPHVGYSVSERLKTLQQYLSLILFWNYHIWWFQEAIVERSIQFLTWTCQVIMLTKADVSEVECQSFCHLRRTVKQ